MINHRHLSQRTVGSRRRGAIAVLALLFTVVLLGMVAFAVDLGYVLSAQEELQRSADAAALATCWSYGQELVDGCSAYDASQTARTTASQYTALNEVTSEALQVDTNSANAANGGVVFGYLNDVYNPGTLDTSNVNSYNAAKVVLRRGDALNEQVPLFFAAVFGRSAMSLQAEATAVIVRDVRGFQVPHDGSNLGILPIALDIDTWNDMLAGAASDDYTWDAETETIQGGADGITNSATKLVHGVYLLHSDRVLR